MPQIKTYGNELWLNAVADNEKYAVSVNPEMVERFCRKLDEYGLNYYAYTTDDFGKIAFNKSDLNLIEQVTAQRIAERVEPFHRRSAVFNRIIGNIGYGKIEDKSFLKKTEQRERDILLKVADVMMKEDQISFSGRVYNDHTTLTFDKGDRDYVLDVFKEIEKQREKLTVIPEMPLFSKSQKVVQVVRENIDEHLFREIQPTLMKAGFRYTANSNLHSTEFIIDEDKAELFCYLVDRLVEEHIQSQIETFIKPEYTDEQIEQISKVAREYFSLSLSDRLFSSAKANELMERINAMRGEFDIDIKIRAHLAEHDYSPEQTEAVRKLVQDLGSDKLLYYLDETYTPDEISEYGEICKEVMKTANVHLLDDYAFDHTVKINNPKLLEMADEVNAPVRSPNDDYLSDVSNLPEILRTYFSSDEIPDLAYTLGISAKPFYTKIKPNTPENIAKLHFRKETVVIGRDVDVFLEGSSDGIYLSDNAVKDSERYFYNWEQVGAALYDMSKSFLLRDMYGEIIAEAHGEDGAEIERLEAADNSAYPIEDARKSTFSNERLVISGDGMGYTLIGDKEKNGVITKDAVLLKFADAKAAVDYLRENHYVLKGFDILPEVVLGESVRPPEAAENSEMPEEPQETETKPDSLSFAFRYNGNPSFENGEDTVDDWFTEHQQLHDFVFDQIVNKDNTISFALANAIVGYLDEKQRIERVNPDLDHIGWYKKTNFIINASIGGDDFTYEGRIDIGDGLDGKAATLINHIRAYNEYVLENNPYHFSEKQIDAFRRNVEILVPFLEQHTELTAQEQALFEQFKAKNPIREYVEEKQQGKFTIYQLPDGKKYHGIRFFGYEENKKLGVSLNKDDYEAVYTGDLAGYSSDFTLENIFFKFNEGEKPQDYAGRSLSVSDVIVTEIDGEQKAYYIDTVGFEEMPEFFREKEIVKENVTETTQEIPKKNKHQILTNAGFDGGIDEKGEYPTLAAAKKDCANYLNDGYLGVCVYDTVTKKIEYVDGDFPLEQAFKREILEQNRIAVEPEKYPADELKVGDIVFYEDKRREVTEVKKKTVKMKSLGVDLNDSINEKEKTFSKDDINSNGVTFLQGLTKIYAELIGRSYVVFDSAAETVEAITGERDENGGFYVDQQKGRDIAFIPADKKQEYGEMLRKQGYDVIFESPLNKAKRLIDEFCESEYGSPADFSNLSRVSLAYTNDEETGAEIQVFANLNIHAIYKEYNGVKVWQETYSTLSDLNQELESLDFDELVYIDESDIAKALPEKPEQEIPDTPPEKPEESKPEPRTMTVGDEFMYNGKKYTVDDLNGLTSGMVRVTSIEEFSDGTSYDVTTYLDGNELAQNGQYLGNFYEKAGLEQNKPTDEPKKELPKEKPLPLRMVTLSKKGDFYEMRGRNAEIGVSELGLTMFGDKVGFPAYLKDNYSEKLRNAGFQVLIEETFELSSFAAEREQEKQEPEQLSFDDFVNDPDYVSEEDYSDKTENAPSEQKKKPAEKQEKTENYHITDDHFADGTKAERFENNLAAIKTLKLIESENRQATAEEQAVLARYVGWGGLADYFKEDNPRNKELAELLTDEEYRAARASTLDSFYTSPEIISGIYSALESFGFKGGNILEPSCGVGNFFGAMPPDMAKKSKLYGVELNALTGRIAKQLYPTADITIDSFQHNDFLKDTFEAAVGNVPFASDTLSYNGKSLQIHDYFFAEALDKVRSGGVVAFITSKGTLDKKDDTFRRMLAEKADLVGAVRLPNNAFRKAAGTDVTADIIFLQKRKEPPEVMPDWVSRGVAQVEYKDENGEIASREVPINKYFEQHPEMVLGKIVEGNKMYGRSDDTSVEPFENADLKTQLAEAVKNLHCEMPKAVSKEVRKPKTILDGSVEAPPELRYHSYFISGEKVYAKLPDGIQEWKHRGNEKQNFKRMKAFIELRDAAREIITAQLHDCTNEELAVLQQKLDTKYEAFRKDFGLLHHVTNKSFFADDVSYNLVCSLEQSFDEKAKVLLEKSPIFTKRTIKPYVEVTHVDTPQEALTMSIAELGRVDLNYMHSLTDMPREDIVNELRGQIFPVPELSQDGEIVYQDKSEYLSGDIYAKLDIARAAAEKDDLYQFNVEMLERSIPEPLKAGDIDVKLGASWIEPKIYQQFMYELFDTPPSCREDKFTLWGKKKNITVEYSPHLNAWQINNKSADNSVVSTKKYGTDKMNAYKIMECILNLRDPKVYKTVYEDGKEKRVLDLDATRAVSRKAELIKDQFKNWIFKDADRRNMLVDRYNKMFNGVRPREFDGSKLSFPGMNPDIQLREHQKNAIAHALYGGNTLFAHSVGAGKTFEMIATAMESKRLGLCTKPMFVVPNHLTVQFGDDFSKLYPGANLLVATKKDFEKANRQKFFAKIATGEYDGIIIGHSQLGKIPMSLERQEQFYQSQIDTIIDGIRELKENNGSDFQVKAMERTRKSLEKQLDKLRKSNQDDVITFEEMGVDKLIVDEAHEFKNLFCATKMQNVAGISNSASQKASDLFQKCRYLDEVTNGRGVTFATGTPVSNSITELHTMMRYLEYGFLEQKGLANFDNWVSVFGEQKTQYELAPAGDKFKLRTRIANYTNMPELMTIFKQVADIRTADTLHLDVPKCNMVVVNAEPSEFQKQLVEELSARSDDVQAGRVQPTVDNLLKITSDGRKVGLDPRLIDPTWEDHSGSKLNQCVQNVLKVHEETKDDKLTQLIFCDLGVPHGTTSADVNGDAKDGEEVSVAEQESFEDCGNFCIYDDIKRKLVNGGIPAEEIAYIHDAKTESEKDALFAKVRSGEIRVLLGSTPKMGTGTNIQDRLIAMHDLDVPWRPADLEQRLGRMVRQGNINKEVTLYRYVTKGTFDAYSYQTLENKQKFIDQAMSSGSKGQIARTMDDVDQQALTYSEIKALCTGDERCKELLVLTDRVKELRSMQQEYNNTHYELENKLNEYPQKKAKIEREITALQSDIDVVRKLPIDPETEQPKFEITLDDVTFTDKTEAGKALDKACKLTFQKLFQKGESVNIGSIHGYPITAKCEREPFSGVIFVQATIHGAQNYKVDFTDSAPHNLRKLEGVFSSLQKKLDQAQERLNRLEVDTEEARKLYAQPFDKGSELEEKSARMQELSDTLHQEAMNKGDDKPRTYYFSMAKTMAIKPPDGNTDRQKQKEIEPPDKKKPDLSDGE